MSAGMEKGMGWVFADVVGADEGSAATGVEGAVGG